MKSLRSLYVPVLVLIAGGMLLPGVAGAQTELENTIKQFSGETAKGYVRPAADLFGANLLAGQFRSAAIPRMGFSIALEIVGMAGVVGDDQMTYTASTPPGFSPSSFKTATIFGGTGATVSHSSNPALTYRGADGVFDVSYMPMVAPQLRIGAVFGTEALVRLMGLPKTGNEFLPELHLLGLGLRHSISQYLPVLPLDVAAAGYYTSFTAGDMIDFKGYSIGVHASKDFAIATLYGGVSYERSTLSLRYNSTDPNFPGQLVDLSFDGDNAFRFTAGAGLNLAFFHLFLDVNVGNVTHFSGGIGFGM